MRSSFYKLIIWSATGVPTSPFLSYANLTTLTSFLPDKRQALNFAIWTFNKSLWWAREICKFISLWPQGSLDTKYDVVALKQHEMPRVRSPYKSSPSEHASLSSNNLNSALWTNLLYKHDHVRLRHLQIRPCNPCIGDLCPLSHRLRGRRCVTFCMLDWHHHWCLTFHSDVVWRWARCVRSVQHQLWLRRRAQSRGLCLRIPLWAANYC